MLTYHRPKTVKEAFSILNKTSNTALPYAGGTDLWPLWTKGMLERPPAILDLKKIDELQGISRVNGEVRVGACVLMSELAANSLIRESAPVLAEAAGRIACPQIRNRATVGGNLCNASPAADTAIPLMLLDAKLDVASRKGDEVETREVPVCDFFTGPGQTVLKPGELLLRARFTPLAPDAFAAWDKFGTRPSMEIAVASVGVLLKKEDGKVAHARVGYGSVAPTPLRGRKTEEGLLGHTLSVEVIAKCEAAARAEVKPITDHRASESYRREMVGVMLRRMLERAQGI